MRLSNRLLTSAAVASATLLAGAAQASTLTGTLTADNEFNAYLSTSDSTLGTLIVSGDNWMSPQSFSTTLAAGVTYYLHVVANNFGGPGDMNGGNPDSFLASLNLSDASHLFANGLQTLNTDTVDWRASANGVEQNLGGAIAWTAPTGAPIDLGQNGGAIWGGAVGGPMAGISTSSHWIWSATDPSGEALFSTTISAVGGVPEPAEWALMIAGFGLAGAALRRRRAVAAAA